MWKQLDKLREQPDDQKKAVALFVAIGITAIIAITWGTMLVSSFSNSEDDISDSSIDKSSQTASPLGAMGSQFKTLKEQIREIKDVVKE